MIQVHTIDLEFQGVLKVIAAFLIPHRDGVVLVESGPQTCWEALKRGLAQQGYAPCDVTDVLLSHIHFDHAGAAWVLAKAGANIHVHPKGIRHLADPTRLWNSAARIYGDAGMEMLWGSMEQIEASKLNIAEDGQVLSIGGLEFIAHHSPGHAKHHIAWQCGEALFTGDVGGVCINNGPMEPPCPPPDIDALAWHTSIKKLIELPNVSRLFLTHFGEQTGDVVEHWYALAERLDAWIAFIQQNQHLEDDALTEVFTSFVDQERQNYEGATECYAFANPAEMSVSGIKRWLMKRDEIAA